MGQEARRGTYSLGMGSCTVGCPEETPGALLADAGLPPSVVGVSSISAVKRNHFFAFRTIFVIAVAGFLFSPSLCFYFSSHHFQPPLLYPFPLLLPFPFLTSSPLLRLPLLPLFLSVFLFVFLPPCTKSNNCFILVSFHYFDYNTQEKFFGQRKAYLEDTVQDEVAPLVWFPKEAMTEQVQKKERIMSLEAEK